ncbi:MAG: GatB/YqeY domain-containing protein [Helicobacteraceae bacterium]|nr:GatB/YqeY domain-containing protein [Helicobacteraceae bacterium]
MSLRVQIKDDIKTAMKAKDVATRDALRLLDSAMKQIEIDERRELSDSDVTTIIAKQVKQRNDSITAFVEGGREELAVKERAEIEIFSKYMPKQLSDDELLAKMKTIIDEVGATTMKDMGKIMGKAKSVIGDSADGKRINEAVKKLLA